MSSAPKWQYCGQRCQKPKSCLLLCICRHIFPIRINRLFKHEVWDNLLEISWYSNLSTRDRKRTLRLLFSFSKVQQVLNVCKHVNIVSLETMGNSLTLGDINWLSNYQLKEINTSASIGIHQNRSCVKCCRTKVCPEMQSSYPLYWDKKGKSWFYSKCSVSSKWPVISLGH